MRPSRTGGVRRRQRRGAVALEFAIVLPVFLLTLVGILEFGRAVMVQQILTNASREGARRAIIPGATDSQVRTLVTTYLNNTSISADDCTINITDGSGNSIDGMNSHDPVVVQITVPYSDVSFGLTSWLGGTTLGSTVRMRKE